MNIIEQWYNEASKVTTIFRSTSNEFIIYKGFKIASNEEGYIIQDVRFSNLYEEVNKKDYDTLVELGFTKGVDYISYQRNLRRVESYKRRAELLYDKRRKFKKELPKNKKLNEKRIRNLNRRIEDFIDHIFFYKTKIKQYEIKYKLN